MRISWGAWRWRWREILTALAGHSLTLLQATHPRTQTRAPYTVTWFGNQGIADLSDFDCDSPGQGLNVILFSEKNTANFGTL